MIKRAEGGVVTVKKMIMPFIVALMLTTTYALTVCAETHQLSYSWNEGGNWDDGDTPIIVGFYIDGVLVSAAYDNGITDTRTRHTIPYDIVDDNKRATVSLTAESAKGPIWTAATEYALDDLVVGTSPADNGNIYFICTRAGTSGSVEPTWSITVDVVIDDPDASGVEWTVKSTAATQWQASHTYSEGDTVWSSGQVATAAALYTCTTGGESGVSEPDWTGGTTPPWWMLWRRWTISGGVADNEVVWMLQPKNSDRSMPVSIKGDLRSVQGFKRVGRTMN